MTIGASRVLARVEDELRALWATPPGAGEPLRSHARTMNLVVVAATPALATQYEAVVDQVVQSVPARAIVVGLDPDGDDDLQATVSAVCTPDLGDGAVVCSERVTLMARGTFCSRLSSCVDAICATDVPTTLVWLARVHAEDPAFLALAREASRIVLDTASSSIASLANVVTWARARPRGERPGVADLAWTRLAPWQELCSRMFDPPRVRPLAARVNRMSLTQATPAGVPIGSEGALLLGWLATRLGWKAASLAGKLRLVRADGSYVQAQLRARGAPEAAPGSLLGLELEAGAAPLRMHGTIAVADPVDAEAAAWQVDVFGDGDSQRLEQHMRMRASDPARLLERTLHRPPHDEALAESVTWADELRQEELVCQ